MILVTKMSISVTVGGGGKVVGGSGCQPSVTVLPGIGIIQEVLIALNGEPVQEIVVANVFLFANVGSAVG